MGGSSLAHGSFTKKTGKKGEAVCSAEKLVLDSTTAQALADRCRTPPTEGCVGEATGSDRRSDTHSLP